MSLYSKALVWIVGGLGLLSSASASLIQSNPFEVNINGTGFGNVSTIITLQTLNGQVSTEAGCVGFNNLYTNCGYTTDGKIKNSSQLEPVPAGVTDASQLRFVFNASQPAGGSITLTNLTVNFYGTTANPLFSASLATKPLTLTSTFPGTGNSGFVFQLDTTQAAAVNAILAQTTSIGGGFSATGASGGQDTLFLGTGPGVTAVPEPSAFLLFGSSLGAVAFWRRRKALVRS